MLADPATAGLYFRIRTVLQKAAYKTASLDHLTDDTRLLEDLGLDSARLVDFVLGLEDEFNIKIEDEAIEGIKLFSDAVQLVRVKTGEPLAT